MIQGGSQDCYLQVTHHGLDFLEAQADYLFRMTWMMVIFHVPLMLMMLIHQMFNPGTLTDFVIHNYSHKHFMFTVNYLYEPDLLLVSSFLNDNSNGSSFNEFIFKTISR